MRRMRYDQPDLSPDLEWMLLSRQASPAMLAEGLASEFSVPIFRLAIAVLEDEAAARDTVRATIRAAVTDAERYHGGQGVQTWIFRRAVAFLRRARRRKRAERWRSRSTLERFQRHPGRPIDPPWTGAALWETLRQFSDETLFSLLLRALLGWQIQEIAPVLGISERQVQADLENAWQKLPAGAPADALKHLTQALQARWPDPELPPPEREALAKAALRPVRRLILRVSPGDLVWIMLAALIVSGLAWSSRTGAPAPAVTPQPVVTPTPSPAPTPDFSLTYFAQPGETLRSIAEKTGITVQELSRLNSYAPDEVFTRTRRVLLPEPAPRPAPTAIPAPAQAPALLTGASSPGEALRRLVDSQALWRTLWADAQFVRYGPPGYIGPPQSYRVQAWLSQPDQSLQLIGPVGGQPDYRLLIQGNYVYFQNAQESLGWFSESPRLLVEWSPLVGMIFPTQANWLQAGGDLEVAGRGAAAGRPAVVVDWKNTSGGRERRLWIDAQTGVILRQREFSGQDGQSVLADYAFAAVAFDASFPAGLFDPRQGQTEYATDAQGETGDLASLPAPATPVQRERLAQRPAPAGFNPALSRLTFQFSPDLSPSETDPQVELFADGYYLGSFAFNNPWELLCARSPDGLSIAYTSKPGGVGNNPRSTRSLHWVELKSLNPQSPVEALEASSFAFSPDSRRLAVFGYRASAAPGVDLVETEDGQITRLIDLAQAESLAWSTDGRQLALIGKRPGQRTSEILVISASTGRILFQAPVDPDELARAYQPPGANPGWPSPDWPGASWGIAFPARMGELEACR